MILDHIGLKVGHYEQSKAFFLAALAPLGIALVSEVKGRAGFGRAGKPEFWFCQATAAEAAHPALHLAFAADDREQVRQFYQAALQAGATDNGPPGIRAHYHPDYYGAFVITPDGHNIEAVCHRPEHGRSSQSPAP